MFSQFTRAISANPCNNGWKIPTSKHIRVLFLCVIKSGFMFTDSNFVIFLNPPITNDDSVYLCDHYDVCKAEETWKKGENQYLFQLCWKLKKSLDSFLDS